MQIDFKGNTLHTREVAKDIIQELAFLSRTLTSLLAKFPYIFKNSYIKDYNTMVEKNGRILTIEDILVYNYMPLAYKKIWKRIIDIDKLDKELKVIKKNI